MSNKVDDLVNDFLEQDSKNEDPSKLLAGFFMLEHGDDRIGDYI